MRPDMRLKITNSGKGVLLLVPVEELGVTLTYITSVKYLTMLLNGELKGSLIGCKYLGEAELERFLSSDEKKTIKSGTLNLRSISSDDPLSGKALKEREAQRVKITDDW
jgi:hypothetical protein